MEQSQQQLSQASLVKAQNDYNALRIRLDTEEVLQRIELFLSGKRTVVNQNPETGKIESSTIKLGVAKANDDGIQSIVNWISATINPQVVQGNFPCDPRGNCEKYDDYVMEYHKELATLLIGNIYNWEVNEDEVDGIIEFIMLLIMPFMSRLIGDGERKSYGETMRTIESNVMRSKGNFPLLNQ